MASTDDDTAQKSVDDIWLETLWRLPHARLLARLPLDVRLAGLSPEVRLAGVAPEVRLAGLDRDHQALALPVEVLRMVTEAYISSLSPEIQVELRRRLATE